MILFYKSGTTFTSVCRHFAHRTISLPKKIKTTVSMISNTYKKYQDSQIKVQQNIFDEHLLGGVFMGKERPFVLKDHKNNFIKNVKYDDVVSYFNANKISWWHGDKPTGHTLSSQISCVNHLFSLRNDPEAVLSIAKQIDSSLDGVELLNNDTLETQGYISFEVVSDTDHLNERSGRKTKLSRGSQCTSIDAIILAKRANKRIMLVIEWKYVEHYGNEDKSGKSSGKTRLVRYTGKGASNPCLIQNSSQLQPMEEYKGAVYFFEPFYQLMRQTLWAEQMIRYKNTESVQSDDYIHVHVVPSDNKELLEKKYISGKNMKDTWNDTIYDKTKYVLISPDKLLSGLPKEYASLIEELSNRYWQ